MWVTLINRDHFNNIKELINNYLPKINDTVFDRYLRLGKILLNEQVINTNSKIKQGDVIKVDAKEEFIKAKHNLNFLKTNGNIKVIYEDEQIIVVYKPKRVYSQSNEHEKIDTLENRIRKYLYQKKLYSIGENNFYIPCLSQRLDYNTSGLVVVGKNINATRLLNLMIANHEIHKYYLAKVAPGKMPHSGTISNYLSRDEKTTKVEFKKNKNNQLAITKYRVIKSTPKFNLLELNLITGRTHQLRVHMNYIGHDIIGERKYTRDKKVSQKYDSQCLVAYKIVFQFKNDYGKLNYLNNKIIKIEPEKFNF